jgi:hypothetical protein
VRDLVRTFEPELRWFRSLGGWSLIDFCWSAATLAILVGRLAPCGLCDDLTRLDSTRLHIHSTSPPLLLHRSSSTSLTPLASHGRYLYGFYRWSDAGGVGALALPARLAYVCLGGFFSSLTLIWVLLMQRVLDLT